MRARASFGPAPGLVLLLALLTAAPFAVAAEGLSFDEDGWYRWQAPAGGQGRDACCYRIHDGELSQMGCNLDGEAGSARTTRECDISADSIQLYAKIGGGRVQDIRAFSGGCPVNAGDSVHELGKIPTARSIEWLLQQLDAAPGLYDEVLMAISLHADAAALDALSGVLEDRQRTMRAREQALFWLAQSDSDAAYAYLDRLLSPRRTVAD